ncbi:hypothetical protein [Pseudomonas citronellolis]|nr:hypothetical protein [Pseudomonas citronellolis]
MPLTSDEKRRLFLPERFSEAQRKEIEKAWSQLDKPAHEMTWRGAPG